VTENVQVTDRRRRGRFKWTAARWLRGAIVIVLGATLLVIGTYLFLGIGRKEATPPRKIQALQPNINFMENVQVVQFKGPKGKIEARGDRSVPAGDGLYRLEGNVEVVDHGRKGGREIKMRGDALTYDKAWENFGFKGHIVVEYEDVRLEGSEFSYDRNAEIMRTESGASISSPNMEATARKLTFWTKNEDVVLEGTVRVSARIRLSPEHPLVLMGRKFSFGFKRRRGTIEGDVVLEHGKSRGRADIAYVDQFADTDDLRYVELDGRVSLHVEEPAAGTPPEAEAPAPKAAAAKIAESKPAEASLKNELRLGESAWQDITASNARVFAFQDRPALEKVELQGAAGIRFFFPSGNITGISGDAVRMDFDTAGRLAALGAGTNARIESRDAGGGLLHVLEGSSVRYLGETSAMTVARSEASKARLTGASSEVLADTLTIFIDKDDFEAQGGVQLRSQSGSAGGPDATKGFFAHDRPIFAQSESLRFSQASRRFFLWDRTNPVRAWQEDKVLRAKEITIIEDGVEVLASGAVQSVFPHKPASGPPRQIAIAADRMRYDQPSNQVVYEGACTLLTGGAILKSAMISVESGEKPGSVRTMRATKSESGPVKIVMGDRDATGGVAVYDVDADTITVTDRPLLREKDTGEVRGDKLTFYLSDGRIQVQERSSITIKS
jgi:lipopolysaccharide transport protein LptA